MPQHKPHNGTGPRQTYYVNKPIKSPHKTMFKAPPPLTYQFGHKKQTSGRYKLPVSLLSSFMIAQNVCAFDSKSDGSSPIIR